jgi:hypothetical protein
MEEEIAEIETMHMTRQTRKQRGGLHGRLGTIFGAVEDGEEDTEEWVDAKEDSRGASPGVDA